MLIRPHDADPDESRWRTFLAAQGFGHFAVNGVEHAVPVVVPTQFTLTADALVFHLAVGNPALDRLAESGHAVMSVAGDWAYIPGSWKAIGDEDSTRGIPTTYYAAVQVSGEAEVIDDPDAVAAGLRLQLGDLEPDGGLVDPSDHGAKLRAIRGVRLPLSDISGRTGVVAKYKFGGNVDEAHRRAVADRLRNRNGPGDEGAIRQIPNT